MSTHITQDDVKQKRPEYLIQWRTSMFVSIREKESNVWKFVTFYATAITLVIGIGQRLAPGTTPTSVDTTFDVAAVAAVVGLLTFWGLAVVIDSNFWMSRNLKMIGNVEKLFLPEVEYGRIIPGSYSSPMFRYARPYTIFFFFLVILGLIAYLNFLLHFPAADQNWRQYLLPFMTVLYVVGFHFVERTDIATHREYLDFFEHARGLPLTIGAETMPREYWAFRLATADRFRQWTSLAATAIVIAYGVRERAAIPAWRLILLLLIIAQVGHWLISRRYLKELRKKEKQHRSAAVDWTILSAEKLTDRFKVGEARKLYFILVRLLLWLPLLGGALLVWLIHWRQWWALLFS